MGKLSTKHADRQTTKRLSDFSGGINLSQSQENIADNELLQANNLELDMQNGMLKVVDGIVVVYDTNEVNEINRAFYDTYNKCWLYSIGQNLYKSALILINPGDYAYSDDNEAFSDDDPLAYYDFDAEVLIGALTGNKNPIFAVFNGIVYIASGGYLQKWNGTTLTSIAAAKPDSDPLYCDYVTDRLGRLVVFDSTEKASNLYYSGLYDGSNWNWDANNALNAQYQPVGWGDPGTITSIVPLSTDIVVFKSSNRAYRVIGEPSTDAYQIVEAGRQVFCQNKWSAIPAVDTAIFIGNAGLWSYGTVQKYGAVARDEIGLKINNGIIPTLDDNCRLFFVPSKKQVWIQINNSKQVYIYHYTLGAFTTRTFKYNINDVVTINKTTYVIYGTKIAKLDDSLDTDDGTQITASFITKRWTFNNYALIKRILAESYNDTAGTGLLTVGKYQLPLVFDIMSDYAFSDDDFAFSDDDYLVSFPIQQQGRRMKARDNSFDVTVNIYNGKISLRSLLFDIAEVG